MKWILQTIVILLLGCSQNEPMQAGEEAINPSADQADKVIKVEPETWTFDKVSGTSLVFKEGHIFDTKVEKLTYIGQIDIDDKPPFLVFSGLMCDRCKDLGLYFYSPRSDFNATTVYSYPSRLNKSDFYLIDETRAFFGEVNDSEYGIIFFSYAMLKDKTDRNMALLVKIDGERVVSMGEVKPYKYYFEKTLALNREGKNQEIKQEGSN